MTVDCFRLNGESLDDWSDILDAPTRACWPIVAEATPDSGVLMGGTALSMYLRHRRSRALDVFVHEPFNPEKVLEGLQTEAAVAVHNIAEGTLNGTVNGVSVQFLHASDQSPLDEPIIFEGLAIGSVRDIAATKYKVIGDRGEMRDYYDLMRIATDAGISANIGLRLYSERYGVTLEHPSVAHIVTALGSFADVADDPWLAEATKADVGATVTAYWQQRQPEIAAWLATMLD